MWVLSVAKTVEYEVQFSEEITSAEAVKRFRNMQIERICSENDAGSLFAIYDVR